MGDGGCICRVKGVNVLDQSPPVKEEWWDQIQKKKTQKYGHAQGNNPSIFTRKHICRIRKDFVGSRSGSKSNFVSKSQFLVKALIYKCLPLGLQYCFHTLFDWLSILITGDKFYFQLEQASLKRKKISSSVGIVYRIRQTIKNQSSFCDQIFNHCFNYYGS